jgi:hypothetical protein
MLGIMLLQNRSSGSRITSTALETWVDAQHERIALADIDHAKVIPWMEGSWNIRLELKNGASKPLPSMCYGSSEAFAEALRARGVRIV